jgi:hypothetical protein
MDMGKVPPRAKCELSIQLINRSKVELHIHANARDFGCSDARIVHYPKVLIPGLTKSIVVQYTIEGEMNRSVLGFVDIVSHPSRHDEHRVQRPRSAGYIGSRAWSKRYTYAAGVDEALEGEAFYTFVAGKGHNDFNSNRRLAGVETVSLPVYYRVGTVSTQKIREREICTLRSFPTLYQRYCKTERPVVKAYHASTNRARASGKVLQENVTGTFMDPHTVANTKFNTGLIDVASKAAIAVEKKSGKSVRPKPLPTLTDNEVAQEITAVNLKNGLNAMKISSKNGGTVVEPVERTPSLRNLYYGMTQDAVMQKNEEEMQRPRPRETGTHARRASDSAIPRQKQQQQQQQQQQRELVDGSMPVARKHSHSGDAPLPHTDLQSPKPRPRSAAPAMGQVNSAFVASQDDSKEGILDATGATLNSWAGSPASNTSGIRRPKSAHPGRQTTTL